MTAAAFLRGFTSTHTQVPQGIIFYFPCHAQNRCLFLVWHRHALYRRLLTEFPGNLFFTFPSLLLLLNGQRLCAHSLLAFSSYKVTLIISFSFAGG